MKITKMLLFLFLAVVAVSCNKNDDDNQNAFDYNATNLRGTYELNFFRSTEVVSELVSGFTVVTTTTSTGDTFDVTALFAENNTVTSNGTYRISEVVEQGGQSMSDAYIVVLNNEVSGYAVNSGANQLTIDGETYQMVDFTQSGFKLILNQTTSQPNGDSTVYSEELRFSRR